MRGEGRPSKQPHVSKEELESTNVSNSLYLHENIGLIPFSQNNSLRRQQQQQARSITPVHYDACCCTLSSLLSRTNAIIDHQCIPITHHKHANLDLACTQKEITLFCFSFCKANLKSDKDLNRPGGTPFRVIKTDMHAYSLSTRECFASKVIKRLKIGRSVT